MINLLTLIVIVMAVLTIWRLIRVMELVRDLRGEEEPVTAQDNNYNGKLAVIFMIVCFLGMIFFTIDAKKYLLPIAASKHGVLTDNYLYLNFGLISVVFFITQFLLFWYLWKYRHKKGEKAYFYPVDHKLEFIWTVIPSIVLMGLIVYGLKLWMNITQPAPADAMVIEIYGKQFDWTARFSGEDNKLGHSNFKMIADDNPLGVDSLDVASNDDIIAREMHFPVGIPIDMQINSRDVLHSFYLPHFRVQMNAVPGMNTRFYFKPTITTAKMREITGNPNFDYVLLCNKICGVAHYNMKMKIVVDEPDAFRKWLKNEKLVFEKPAAPALAPAPVVPAAMDAAPAKNEKKITALN